MRYRTHRMKIRNIDYVSGLPQEILENILQHLNARQLAICRRVSRRWRDVISQSDFLWSEKCKEDYEVMSKHAKVNSYPGTLYYSIYRNLKLWPTIGYSNKKFVLMHRNSQSDNETSYSHLSQGILVINDVKQCKLMDVKRARHKTIIINGRVNVLKVYSVGNLSAILFVEKKENAERYLYVQKTVENGTTKEADFSDVKHFSIFEDELFYSTSLKTVFRVDLTKDEWTAEHCFKSLYDIEDIIVEEKYDSTVKHKEVTAFTKFGYMVTYSQMNAVNPKTFCWSKSQNYILRTYSVLGVNMFICYLNKVIYMHMPSKNCFHYGFPNMVLAELYGDNIILVTEENKVLLFSNLLEHDRILETSFIVIGNVPRKEKVLKLCITESNKGPIIMISSDTSIYMLRPNFSSVDDNTSPFDDDNLYARLLTLRDRIEKAIKTENKKPRSSRKRKLDE